MAPLLAFVSAVFATVVASVFSYLENQRGPEISVNCPYQGNSLTRPSEDDQKDVDTIRRFMIDHSKIFNLRHVEKTCISRYWDESNGVLRCYFLDMEGADPLNRAGWEMCLTPRGEFFDLRTSE
ncbi:MAG: hypothetical protein IBJ13_13450 [Sphingopyxis sp.]|nr:hypothetical protein [Sphingopyxis sp.]